MKILFIASGSPATVFALAPLATAARSAGHEVIMGAIEDMVSYIAGAGLPAVSIAPSSIRTYTTTDLAGNPLKMPETPAEEIDFAGRWFARIAAGCMDSLIELTKSWRPDLVVGGSMSFAAGLIARHLDIPYVRQAWDTGDAWRTDPAAEDELMPVLRSMALRGLPEPDLFIDICPPSLRPADAPPAQMMRWIPANAQRRLEPWMYTRGEKPRVCVTSGSRLAFAKKIGFLRDLVSDISALNAEPVVATLDEVAGELRDELPGVRVGWVPLDVVVPTCDLVIHHAGGVTALTAMNAGVPQLIVPQGGNFVEAAYRIADFGAAITLKPGEHTSEAVEQACRTLLCDPSYAERARELAREIADLPPPAEVVGALERLVQSHLTMGQKAKLAAQGESEPIRVVAAKVGAFGDPGGPAPIAQALRDSGIEVSLADPGATPEDIVALTVAQRADAICVTSLAGTHRESFSRVVQLLRDADAAHVTVFGGGMIPAADIPALMELGVDRIFTLGTPMWAVADWVRGTVRQPSVVG